MNYQLIRRPGIQEPFRIMTWISFLLLSVAAEKSQAQSAKPVATACVLSGADTVSSGSLASYVLGSCSADTWTASCGTIADQHPGSVTVNFAVTGCSSLVITAMSGGKAVATKKVTVVAAPAMTAGVIGNASQAVNYGKAPGLLTAPPAAGGICGGSYSYQWLSSGDNINFSAIAGAVGKDYQPGPLTATTWFKRQVSCAASAAPVMTNTVIVTVYPVLSLPRLSPATQSVNANASGVAISLGSLSGGSGHFTYQWQQSSSSAFAIPVTIAGAASTSYTPGNIDSTTFFRVGVINNGDTSYSAPAVVNVFPSLNAGGVTPVSQTVQYDSVPTLLSNVAVAGGNGMYAYQWYCSTDNSNWTLLAGVGTPNYNPGGLEATTWFRVLVISNGLPATSTASVVYVNPKNQ